MSVPSLLNLSMSGYPMVGDDIGGFAGSPTPDLLTRWIELGAFNPLFRDHTEKGSLDQEPWVHGPEHEAIRKKFIETRYKLLPYIYTASEEMSRTGMPLMRPMLLEFPNEPQVSGHGGEFMFGHDLLVAPKLLETLDAYVVGLPRGIWYDFWSGKKIEGGKGVQVSPKLDELPVYVRGGAVVPNQAVIQHTGEIPAGPLVLSIYPDNGCSGSVYSDDGHTFEYQKGVFAKFSVTCDAKSDFAIHISKTEGSYVPWFKQLELRIFGVDKRPRAVNIDGQAINEWQWSESDNTVSLKAEYNRSGSSIAIQP
jgi:alpha-glucosidase